MNMRAKFAFAITCGLLCVAGAGDARTVPASTDWTGTWRLDLAHSRFSRPAPKAETRTITLSDNRMSVRSSGADPAGRATHFNYSVTLDGRFHPLIGNPDGDSISMRLTNPHKVQIAVRRKGELSATATTEVSPRRLVMDRRRLTRSGSPSEDVLVYDRVP
jgi:hypothetical protein